MQKQCTRCLYLRSETAFPIDSRNVDCLSGVCRKCVNERKLERKLIAAGIPIARPVCFILEEDPPPPLISRVDDPAIRKHKNRARGAVSRAIKKGRILRRGCEVCGSPHTEGHHDSYDKPLDVRWLCTKHHTEAHVELRRLELKRSREEQDAGGRYEPRLARARSIERH